MTKKTRSLHARLCEEEWGESVHLTWLAEKQAARAKCKAATLKTKLDSFAPTGIPGPGDNPAPVAWDGQRFDRLGAGWLQVGSDQYGQRVTVWVRLLDRTTGATVFFANTHGPLGDCSTALGDNWCDTSLTTGSLPRRR